MTILEAIENRHSVRQYLDKEISLEIVEKLNAEIEECNKEGDLNIQLITNEPKAFGSGLAHYGKFSNANNYLALVGKNTKDLDEKCGYYGEKIVLLAQTLGLNTCWVKMTFSKSVAKEYIKINEGEKMPIVIALGYGATQGVKHKSKPLSKLAPNYDEAPSDVKKGIDAAILAPTAMNQQKFNIVYKNGEAKINASLAPCYKIDLGIVKCHFEIGKNAE